MIFLIHSYFSLISRNLIHAMKTLYQAHGLIEEISESGGILSIDLKIVLNFMSFIVLWKIEKFQKANEFLVIAHKTFEASRFINKISRINAAQIEMIIHLGIAAIKVKAEGDIKQAKKIVAELYKKYQKDQEIDGNILKEFWKAVNIEYANINMNEYNNKDILLTQDFEELLLEICISPFISESYQIVSEEKNEIPQVRFRTRTRIASLSDKTSINSSTNSRCEPENYNPKVNYHVKKTSIDTKLVNDKVSNIRVAVYSPILGVLRSKSSLRRHNRRNIEKRPKSQEKCKY